ncbi:MAG TPA: hypothetical protein VK474_04655 [Chthoniobacterales bacterium]|nr:hypothetical protein [Chthoniobacterales bacterium]
MIGPISPGRINRTPPDVKSTFPNRTAFVLAGVAFVLLAAAIALNYFRGGEIRYAHIFFALGLLAFVVWFSGRRERVE